MTQKDEPHCFDNAAREKFFHPYQPYEIQRQFMTSLYQCIEEGKIGIFESPTGTGKSLSLICGSLTWLREHKRRTFEEGVAAAFEDDNDEPKWMRDFARKQARKEALQNRQDLEDRLSKIRAKEKKIKERYNAGEPLQKRRKIGEVDQADGPGDSQFLLDDYESDDGEQNRAKNSGYDESGLSLETQALMQKLGYETSNSAKDKTETIDELKIFYCSRTHSQLGQFANELKRVRMPPAISSEDFQDFTATGSATDIHEAFKHLTLGSRKNLCINAKVNKLGTATAINERCLELQQPKTSSDCKCPYLPTKETEALVNDFRDHAIAEIRDIEDLGTLGKKMGVCPYYASRPAIKPSEIVTLPYPLLLQTSAREALNLSLKGHVVIIDEAHNLMDAITGIYSISITLVQLHKARSQLTVYLKKFNNRLKGKNRVYVAQLLRLIDSVALYLQNIVAVSREKEGSVKVSSMLAGKGVDQIDLFKLIRYIQESKLARKVDGYIVHQDEENAKQIHHETTARAPSTNFQDKSVPVLTHLQGFLLALMNPSSEGRFFFSKEEHGGISIRYALLDPTHHFKEIVKEARSVILAGGTMSPMADYEQHLFSYLPASRIMTLSCGHVIPKSNLLANPVMQGISGAEFDFTFEGRNSPKTIIELGNTLLAVLSRIPDGVVVFFPSYSYLDTCITSWKRSGANGSGKASTIWNALSDVKPIFLESRSRQATPKIDQKATKETATETVLQAYSNAVLSDRSSRGALLLAVTGGSLSEGINFSDRLGRGVIVVGLPFPNPHSAEWKSKMAYISSKASASGQDGKAAAREFYENVCMRAVNQCIGRAIRHQNDYAAILMMDRRYGTKRIQDKLPGWIRGSLKEARRIEDGLENLRSFFESKAQKADKTTHFH